MNMLYKGLWHRLLAVLVVTAGCAVPMNGQEKQLSDISKHIDIYTSLLKELELNYVDTLNHERLMEFAIGRMLYSLDPYTVYIPEKEEEAVRTLRSGEYGGIGSIITQVEGKVCIYDPYEGMPAQKSDVRAGDVILEVDGVSAEGKSVAQVSEMLRGVPGTEITLKLRREGEKKPIVRKFTREVVQITPIPYYGTVAPGVGYIVFNDFIDKSFVEFKRAMDDLTKNYGVEKLIVDLRSNGGGLIDQAAKIASLFVPNGTEIASIRGKDKRSEHIYRTTEEPLYPDMPLAFIVGENTASSAEILSGAMQDLDRAAVFGTRTFGKGLVQSIRQLPHNGYLKVTTAKYYLPSGRCVQAVDYAQRQNAGRDYAMPDSLTDEFLSVKGRVFLNNSGITPDVECDEQMKVNIAYYMYAKNLYFQYANRYCLSHSHIATADSFALTEKEYADFVAFVKEKKFTYTLESERYLEDLRDLVEMEGLSGMAGEMFDSLSAVLQPDIDRDIMLFEDDVRSFLESEIVKRYYFQRGVCQYNMRRDRCLDKAVEYLGDEERWNAIFDVERQGEEETD